MTNSKKTSFQQLKISRTSVWSYLESVAIRFIIVRSLLLTRHLKIGFEHSYSNLISHLHRLHVTLGSTKCQVILTVIHSRSKGLSQFTIQYFVITNLFTSWSRVATNILQR